MGDDEVWFNDIWSFYFHDPYDDNWTKDGYTNVCTIGNSREFWTTFQLVRDNLHKGMFFMMREHIFPIWNDDENKDGGFMSIKILKEKAADFCEELMVNMLNENSLKEVHRKHWVVVNGISISPKRHFCIIKIWLKNTDMKDPDMFNIPEGYYGNIIFKTNTFN
jgi:hypothetical protein